MLEKKYDLYKKFIKQKRNEMLSSINFNNKIFIGNLITKSNLKNKDNKDLPVLSINNKLGFILQKDQFNEHEIASSDKSNYKIVKKGEFAYNPARINVGSIAKLDYYNNGIISPMYIVFKVDTNLINLNYLNNYFKTETFKKEMFKRLEGSVRLTLSYDSLSNIPISLPSMENQEKISNFLLILNNKISIIEKDLNNIKDFKCGLLQRMFV